MHGGKGGSFRSYEKVTLPELEYNNVCRDDAGADRLSDSLRYGGCLPLTVLGRLRGYFCNVWEHSACKHACITLCVTGISCLRKSPGYTVKGLFRRHS